MGSDDLPLKESKTDLSRYVTDEGGIWSLRGAEKVRGWNNIEYAAGLSHIHVDFDVMIYILEGSVRHEYGTGCKKSVVHSAGDMFFIEPGLPHEVFNCSETEWVHAIVARSDASEWQNIIPYDRND